MYGSYIALHCIAVTVSTMFNVLVFHVLVVRLKQEKLPLKLTLIRLPFLVYCSKSSSNNTIMKNVSFCSFRINSTVSLKLYFKAVLHGTICMMRFV